MEEEESEENWIRYRVFGVSNVGEKVKEYCAGYVFSNEDLTRWQAFQEAGEAGEGGELHFCDCISDEWFVVWVLLKLTEVEDGCVVQVEDNDGEFLLIEGADFLPDWISPENSRDRVFLFEGKLHLVSPALVPEVDKTLDKCLAALRKDPLACRVSEAFDEAVLGKFVRDRFPSPGKEESRQRCWCMVPTDLEHLLKRKPRAVLQAAHRVYHCTTEEVREVSIVSPQEAFTRVPVYVSRFAYAHLCQKPLVVPESFLKNDSVGQALRDDTNELHKAALIGVKIVCGLKLLEREKADIWEDPMFGMQETVGMAKDSVGEEEEEMDDDWLDVEPSKIEKILSQCQKGMEDVLSMEEVKEFVEGMKDFLARESDFEGVEGEQDAEATLDLDKLLEALGHHHGVDADGTNEGEEDEDGSSVDNSEFETALQEEMDSQLKSHQAKKDDCAPVDVDLQLVENMLNAFAIEQGSPGPASSLLSELGFGKQ